MSEHTPGEVKYFGIDSISGGLVYAGDGVTLAQIHWDYEPTEPVHRQRTKEEADANGRRLALCWNQHDALTAKAALLEEAAAAIEAAVKDARGRSGGSVYMIRAAEFQALKALLAKAKGSINE